MIDNAHPDSPLVIVDNQKNWGFAGGNNVGLRLALSNSEISHVWLLNNDTRVDANALDALLASAENRPAVGLWGATVLYDEPAGQVQALGGGALNRITAETRHLCAFTPAEEVPDNPQFIRKIEAEMAYVLGASMFATRAWLETVGLLDERYFLYYEELDWAERGRPHFALGYARDCIVVHKEGASIGTAPGGGSALSVHHLHRSRFLFARRFFTRAGIPGVIVGSLKQQMKYVLRGNFRLAKAATTGMFDGLRQRSVV
ncbi:glycosyltransferase family protein [Cupriavidus yeoncheonensis]|uniref:glycosyltransferase family 2 protein n=1 Tax=Cupriavidus yeoncheonensis TaxID=1462994 RepID=UPI001BA90512|nr:glycosyltransferase family 2 protein [Cupriavidus yeoncheonensis]